ncbi:MAG: 7-cyano-7-deazaguanine synthase QueC [Pseudomonadota bacterium]
MELLIVNKQKAITLLSGGLDSMVATLLAAKDLEIGLSLTFDYGQRAAQPEIKAATGFCQSYQIKHQVIALPWLAKLSDSALNNAQKDLPKFMATELDMNEQKEKASAKQVWVPNRNALFLNIAACYAEANNCQQIVTGFNLEEATTFPDNSWDFVQAQNKAFKYSTLTKPQISTPVQNMKKTQMVKEAKKLELDWNLFWSCYEGKDKMCGECESCARTMRAFSYAGLLEKIKDRFLKS